jgi:eukaryotic-like serine/threonine-protein kinase
MPARDRPFPVIPDHEVLRKIGGGAYGEVWLARGVTGAMRAVKVVWREDFEDERGFEREFEGILKFEPISRDHPALVNILHVGRSPDGAFYYYVMQLGDDITTGREINPIEYEPRTLRADHPKAVGKRWDTDECLDIGLSLAEALEHLHERGLAHRDVKPSNIIFVNGRAKLADIGLVAARGQQTFVGTEGFVPPEGPGSAPADIYSLGKVLYEIATGLDRMNFPELPEDMPTGSERKRWLELNRVICDVCEPRLSKRAITTAAEMAEAIRRIKAGRRMRPRMSTVWVATGLLSIFTCWAAWQLAADSNWLSRVVEKASDPAPEVGLLRVFSTPEGADVYDEGGQLIGTTPTPVLTATVGRELSLVLRKQGYEPEEIRGRVTLAAASEPMVLSARLRLYRLPVEGQTWEDPFGGRYPPQEEFHAASGYVTEELWQKFSKKPGAAKHPVEMLEISQDGKPVKVVLTNQAAAVEFGRWFHAAAMEAGYLTPLFEARAEIGKLYDNPAMSERARKEQLRPFRMVVRRFEPGSLRLTSEPPGTDVYLNGSLVGNTREPLLIPGLKPGPVQLMLVLEGFKPLTQSIRLEEGKNMELALVMQRNEGVVFGRPWENGLRMRFVPVGPDLMASVWETRVGDFAQFVSETGHPAPPTPPFTQEPDHPVINVTREDARAFGKWLTERERKRERITRSHEYRLPTDLEWSQMAGLVEEEGVSPGWRDARKEHVFPWGETWPDGGKTGNFADMSAARMPGFAADRTIAGYDDGFPFTAPVGSFPANSLGIHDLSGNVQEWVEDEYSRLGSDVLGALRGGGWNTYQIEQLYTGSRNAVPPDYRDLFYGFRVVLAKVPPVEE